ncbi:hypothetical protein CSUNSWCD_122 [Campylobacter showae CSUNSWCD]|uniref:Uncharacterized protein n=1 Tax=Campylobacter showae CSUNSWCD TaxID=1244083 RepID=M5II08_9BACT|nr:hypothetical protein CSUNSWCD_122 [Campylobacter showae CSUNSWCD]
MIRRQIWAGKFEPKFDLFLTSFLNLRAKTLSFLLLSPIRQI